MIIYHARKRKYKTKICIKHEMSFRSNTNTRKQGNGRVERKCRDEPSFYKESNQIQRVGQSIPKAGLVLECRYCSEGRN